MDRRKLKKNSDLIKKLKDDGDLIKTLVEQIGVKESRNIIQSAASLRSSEDFKDNAILTIGSDFVCVGVQPIAKALKEKKVLKWDSFSYDILEIIHAVEDFKDLLFLSQADSLVVYYGELNVVTVRNSAQPKSGKSIYIEMKSCRKELKKYLPLSSSSEPVKPQQLPSTPPPPPPTTTTTTQLLSLLTEGFGKMNIIRKGNK